ncbi:MAG: Nif11 family protein [Acidimicrobiales bacterium]|jgi:predicted ribosomally synthesized peptide with nif11-like leader|nr:Nif11 family protein [Acidimicrobiales bacterium]
MSVDKAKEFLVDVAEDEAAAARVQEAYLDGLLAVARELGYDLTRDDVSIAIEEMSGLTDEEPEVVGHAFSRGGFTLDSFTVLRGPASMGVIADPLGLAGGFGPRRPGRF